MNYVLPTKGPLGQTDPLGSNYRASRPPRHGVFVGVNVVCFAGEQGDRDVMRVA